jgi:hypothetical protein
MSSNREVFVSGSPLIVPVTVPTALVVKKGDMLIGDLSSGVWGTIAIADAAGEKPVLIAMDEHEASDVSGDVISCYLVSNDAVYNYLVDNADYASAITFGDRFEITGEQQLGLVTTDNIGCAMAVEAKAAVTTGTARYCNVVFMQPKQFRANT